MLHEFWLRLKALVSRRKFDRDLDDEIAFHLAMREEKNRAAAGTDDLARQAARRQFGNATLAREELREMRSFTLLETLWQDLCYGVRLLRKSPMFTLVAVMTLAFGIGANTSIFSLTYQVLLRRLPVPHPEELVVLRSPGPKEGQTSSDGDTGTSFSYPLYKDLRRDGSQVFTGLLARFPVELSVSGLGHTERAAGELVSGNYFEVLGVAPALGRVFGREDETAPGANPVAMLSHGYWTRRFGNDPSVLNKQISVNGTPLTVVGVARVGFTGVQIGQMPDIFVPITMKAQITPSWDGLEDRKMHWVAVLGRLKPGMSRTGAEAAVQAVFRPLLQAEIPLEKVPDKVQPRFLARKLLLDPGSNGRPILQRDTQEPLVFLMAMAALVLLMACANLASLMIAKGEVRQREIAVRLSLGASRRRVLRQLLTEGFLLALAGGIAGLGLAPLILRAVLSAIPMDAGMLGLTADLDQRLLGFALALAVATTLLFALMPALRLVRVDPQTPLKEQGNSASGGISTVGLRKWLTVAQVVLTTVLLAGAGLFTQSLINIRNVDLGIRTDHVVQFTVAPGLNRYSPAQTLTFVERLRKAIATQPGVLSVSAAEIAVFTGNTSQGSITAEGYTAPESERVAVSKNWIGPDYFSTMKVPLIAGREFQEHDKADSPQVAIVNQTLAQRYFAGRDPIGKHIIFGQGNVRPDIEIVGVVKDSKHEDAITPIVPFAYMTYAQDKSVAGVTFYVRTAQDPLATAATLRTTVADLDSALPVYELKTLDEQLKESMFGDRILAYFCLWMGSLAAMLAALGLYGVMAYMVARRTREIGIRMALGATRDSVAWLVLREVLRMTAVGLAAGLCAALLTGKLIESQLFGVKGWSPLVLGLTVLLLAATALAAGILPARRAARVQPMIALRYE
ncbi:MAG: ABC transporter permease [Acidobacteriia bacterium]|nr:ABC transporter permease [Terriglobia bacterium]